MATPLEVKRLRCRSLGSRRSGPVRARSSLWRTPARCEKNASGERRLVVTICRRQELRPVVGAAMLLVCLAAATVNAYDVVLRPDGCAFARPALAPEVISGQRPCVR